MQHVIAITIIIFEASMDHYITMVKKSLLGIFSIFEEL